jgi:hypothetical protein
MRMSVSNNIRVSLCAYVEGKNGTQIMHVAKLSFISTWLKVAKRVFFKRRCTLVRPEVHLETVSP